MFLLLSRACNILELPKKFIRLLLWWTKLALEYGLINRVVLVALYLAEAYKLASEIAQLSPITLQLAKEAVLRSFKTTLEGMYFERKNCYLTFASQDQAEGMAAFIEKHKPGFKGH